MDGKVVYSNNDAENPFKDTWTLKNVQANSEVVAYFGEDQNGDDVPDAPTYLTVTARAGENGAISPSGTLLVKRGESELQHHCKLRLPYLRCGSKRRKRGRGQQL